MGIVHTLIIAASFAHPAGLPNDCCDSLPLGYLTLFYKDIYIKLISLSLTNEFTTARAKSSNFETVLLLDIPLQWLSTWMKEATIALASSTFSSDACISVFALTCAILNPATAGACGEVERVEYKNSSWRSFLLWILRPSSSVKL